MEPVTLWSIQVNGAFSVSCKIPSFLLVFSVSVCKAGIEDTGIWDKEYDDQAEFQQFDCSAVNEDSHPETSGTDQVNFKTTSLGKLLCS